MSNANEISMSIGGFLQLAMTVAAIVAALWIGVLAVKHQRKAHLFWIIPFVIARLVSTSVPYILITLRQNMAISQIALVAGAISLITGFISLIAMTALVVVIWKSLDQGETAIS